MNVPEKILKNEDFYQTSDLALATTISLFYPPNGRVRNCLIEPLQINYRGSDLCKIILF